MSKDLIVKEKKDYLKVSGKTKYRLKELGKSLGYAGIFVSGIGISLIGAPVLGIPMFLTGFVGFEQK